MPGALQCLRPRVLAALGNASPKASERVGEAGVKIDSDLELFMERVVTSLVMWELLVFICQNPGITDNVDGIAKRLGRRALDLLEPLDVLVRQDVLRKWGGEKEGVYAYNPSSFQKANLKKFMDYTESKEGKLLIWSQLLKQGIR